MLKSEQMLVEHGLDCVREFFVKGVANLGKLCAAFLEIAWKAIKEQSDFLQSISR